MGKIKRGLAKLGHGLMVTGFFAAPAMGSLVPPDYGEEVRKYGEHKKAERDKRANREDQADRLADSEQEGSEVTSR